MDGIYSSNKEETICRRSFARHYYNGGFALTELIIAVIIIGILVGIILPRYQKSVEKRRIAEASATLKTIYSSQMRYAKAMDTYAKAASYLDLAPITNKYFTFNVKYENSSPTNIYTNETLSTAVRNRKGAGPFADSYVIAITETGDIYSPQLKIR